MFCSSAFRLTGEISLYAATWVVREGRTATGPLGVQYT